MSTQSLAMSDVVNGNSIVTGTWTSASTPENHLITVPFHVSYVEVKLNVEGTAVDELHKHIAAPTQTNLITGSTGASTTPADAAGIAITNNTDGTATVDVDQTSQTASGINYFWMIPKP